MSKRSWRDTLDRYLLPLCALLLVLIATQVTVANLPNNKLFAGHDTGFYTLFPDQLIRTSAGTWEVKTALGFPNFQALVTLPFALLVVAVHAFHPSGPFVGRMFYELQILLCGFGTFWISWLILEKFYAEASRLLRAVASLTAALVGTFNIFTAVLLMYPPSNFQLGIFVWPAVIAFELYLLWKRPAVSMAVLFGVLLTLATLGNPAHTILGFALVAGIYLTNSIATKTWRWPLLATVALVSFSTSAFFWLPAFASVFIYHGTVSAPEGANAAALIGSEDLIKLRTTIAALLRFDGLLWWPKTRNAELYASAPMVIATYIPTVLALVALFSRRWIARALWVLLLIGVELAKNAHPPFQLNVIWLMTNVPVLAAFRQAYDKFVLYIMLALPALTAIGLIVLLRQRRFLPVGIAAIVVIVASSWPFVAGRVAEPYFLTRIPNDYRAVDRIMGADPQARVLSVPGGTAEIHVTDWFKGGNFENLLYRIHTVNAAVFRHRSISAAPLYDDFDLVAAQELPDLVGLLGIYDIRYVLLHKDYLTSYRMAFDFERYKVLGPLLARASERFLDGDKRLQKVYEGPSLVLYRVSDRATLPHAYGSYAAGVASAYENTLFGLVDAGLMSSARHPDILFLGNQASPAGPRSYDALGRIAQNADYLIQAPLIPESPALYREQISLDGGAAQTLAQRAGQLDKPTAFVFVQPHGDWLKGSDATQDNIAGAFSLKRPQLFDVGMVASAHHVPKLAYQDFVGLPTDAPWRLSAFAEEPAVDDIISEADLFDPDALRVPGAPEPFLDPAATEQPTMRAATSVTTDRTSRTYHVRLQRNGEVEELVVASRELPGISLLNDPRVTLDYELSDPKSQAAWLRFDLSDPQGRRIFLDKQLNLDEQLNEGGHLRSADDKQLADSGHPRGFDVRDSLQAGLDKRFSQLVALHQSDPLWAANQPLFNPEQADRFRLNGVRLIMGKPPFSDFSRTATDVSLRFRGLQIALAGSDPQAYPKEGYHVDLAAVPLRPQLHGVNEITSVRKNGAVLFSATAAAGRTDASVSFTLPLPHIDSGRYRELHLRYWQPTANQELVAKLGFRTGSGVHEEAAGLVTAPNAAPESALLPEWISKSSFQGFDPPIVLNNEALVPAGDQGWRDLVCDLQRVAAYRAGTPAPQLVYVTLKFRQTPSTDIPVVPNLLFGFGDMAFVGQTAAGGLRPPTRGSLLIDGKPQDALQVAALGGRGDQLALRFQTIKLSPGSHRVMTQLPRPWAVRSVTLVPHRLPAAASPAVTIRHLDDELFAVHVDRRRPMWLSFAETFHSGWRLIEAPAPRNRLAWTASLRWLGKPAGDHVVGNAYNNTWFVAGSAPADFVIDFAPQDFALLGKIVALVATLVALGLAAYRWRR